MSGDAIGLVDVPRRRTVEARSWPVPADLGGRLFGWLIVVIVAFVALGELLTWGGQGSVITRLDQRFAEWLVAQRTSTLDDLSHWGSGLSDTFVKIGATAVVCAVFLAVWRRWNEIMLVALSLIFEATAFIVTTFIVDRPRPDVPALQDSPVDTTFPSGHVAAATVYAAFAVVVFWHTRRRWARVLAVSLAVIVPLIVAVARLYQGMHYLSDVIAGVLLGLVSLMVVVSLVPPPEDALTGQRVLRLR